jgi:hypothetical protein
VILTLHFAFVDSGMHCCGFVKLFWILNRLILCSFTIHLCTHESFLNCGGIHIYSDSYIVIQNAISLVKQEASSAPLS